MFFLAAEKITTDRTDAAAAAAAAAEPTKRRTASSTDCDLRHTCSKKKNSALYVPITYIKVYFTNKSSAILSLVTVTD